MARWPFAAAHSPAAGLTLGGAAFGHVRPAANSLARAKAAHTEAQVLTLILITAVLRLVFAAMFGLGVDESYMVAAGRSLQFGYFDHPPVAWWMAWGAAHLAGSEAPLAVRLPFILLFAASTWLMYRLGAALYSDRAGLWAAVVLNLSPVLGFTAASWVLPDGPLIFALLGFAVCLTHASRDPGRRALGWWLLAGLCAGLALTSKYTAILTLIGAGAYLLTSARRGAWLRHPGPWLAAAAGLLVFMPVIVWNLQHHWASFAFQGGRAGALEFHPERLFTTLLGEGVFILPWLWLPLMILLVAGLRRGPGDRSAWLLCCLGLPPIALFAAVSVVAHKAVLMHWAAPGYLMLIPLLGAVIEERLAFGDRRVAGAIVATAIFMGLLIGLVASEVRFNWLPQGFAPAVAKTNPNLEVIDWTTLKTSLAARDLLDRPNTVIGTTSWRFAGKVDYALGGAAPVICLNDDQRQYGFARPRDRQIGRDVLIIAPDRPDLAEIQREYGGRFATIRPLAPVVVLHAGRPAFVVSLYLGTALRLPAPDHG